VNELLPIIGSSAGLVTILGALLKSWLERRMKSESDERERLIRIETQERERLQRIAFDERNKLMAIADETTTELKQAFRRIAELEVKVLSKDHDLHILTIKYGELEKQYTELTERNRANEDMIKKLIERLVLAEERRRLSTPPAFANPQPHMIKKSEAK
jgi:chromosome segregation ATPase